MFPISVHVFRVLSVVTQIVFVLGLQLSNARADSWPAAKKVGIASPSGLFVVRIIPGATPDGAARANPATAIFYRLGADANYVRSHEVALLNPVAPVFVAVSDTGELVALDNWFMTGFGKVVVVYRPDGQVLRSYDLAQIYGKDELEKFSSSVSSIQWRCPFPPVLNNDGISLPFHDTLGNAVAVNLKTGVLTREKRAKPGC